MSSGCLGLHGISPLSYSLWVWMYRVSEAVGMIDMVSVVVCGRGLHCMCCGRLLWLPRVMWYVVLGSMIHLISFSCMWIVWRYQFTLSISLMTDICEESDCDIDDSNDDDDDVSDLERAAPTPKHWRIAREEALERSLASWLHPHFSGCEGLSQLLENNELAIVQLHLCVN